MVRRPSLAAGSGQETLPEGWDEAILGGQEWSAGPPRRPGVVERPSRRARSGNEALLEYREWLGCPPGVPGVVKFECSQ